MTRREATDMLRQVRWWTIIKTAAAVVGGYLLLAGFDFTTPAKRFEQQDHRIDTLAREVRAAVTSTETILRLSCVSREYTPEQRYLAKLDCDALLRGQGAVQAGGPRRSQP